MLRPLARAALLCPLLATACGDDTTPGNSGSGTESPSTEGADTEASASSGGTSVDDTDVVPLTGLDPDECVGQQGEGPCMVELVTDVPSPELVFGDFDDDGDLDVLARSEETGADGADEVVLLFNDNGHFAEGVAVAYDETPMVDSRPVALARPRAMGRHPADVRSAFLQGTYGALGDVQVDTWWLNGTGLTRFFAPTAAPPAGPWFGDFDGDGNADLVFAPDASTLETLEIHACAGQDCGAPTQTSVSGAPGGPWTILATDTTGDGLDELLVVRTGDSGLEVVVLDNEGGSFSASSTLVLGEDLAPSSARLADIDADGRDDLVLTSTGMPTENSYGSSLHMFTQDGNGGLQTGAVIDAGERVTGFAFSDFDGDGTPDIALRRTDLAVVNIGLGPSFDNGVSYELTAMETGIQGQAIPTWPTEMADLDGNGTLDVVTVTAQGTQRYAVNVLLSAG